MSLQPIFIALVLSLSGVAAAGPTPPRGWRLLGPADGPIHAERVTRAMMEVRADFNGDGRADRAFVLAKQTDPHRAAVFVFVSGKDKAPRSEKLDEYPFSSGEFALTSVRKGCYRSAIKKVCLSASGLLRYEIEYGIGTLYWRERGTWKRMPIARGEFAGL